MKYALVLERCTKTCNDTSTLLASLGYLITPVFSPKKALHAAHMIQFDLIVTCTASNPEDRRSLTGELARCSPAAVLVLLTDAEPGPVNAHVEGVSAILRRPLTADDLKNVIDRAPGDPGIQLRAPGLADERRRRAVD